MVVSRWFCVLFGWSPVGGLPLVSRGGGPIFGVVVISAPYYTLKTPSPDPYEGAKENVRKPRNRGTHREI